MNKEITIYHNPRCSKSRQTLKLLKERGSEPVVVEYLKETPSIEELKKMLMKLNLSPKDIIRKGEQLYKEKFKTMDFNEDEWIRILHENPILIERPIVVRGNRAVIARPPENIDDLF